MHRNTHALYLGFQSSWLLERHIVLVRTFFWVNHSFKQ